MFVNHVVKMVSFWYIDQVITFLLDSDAAEGSNVLTADAIDTTLKKLDSNNGLLKVLINDLCTDAGGGGTREGLAVELDKLSRTISLLLLMIVTCVLHAMNRMMQSPYEKFLGSGGVSSRNCMQLLLRVMHYRKSMSKRNGTQCGRIHMAYPFMKCSLLRSTQDRNILG